MIKWDKLWEQFWFLRGVLAAITLAQLVPQFTSLTQFEFLRAVFAVVAAWDYVATAIGHFVGELPFLPRLGPLAVNFILFTLAFALPAAIAAIQRSKSRLRWLIGALVMFTCCASFVGFLADEEYRGTVRIGVAIAALVLSGLLMRHKPWTWVAAVTALPVVLLLTKPMDQLGMLTVLGDSGGIIGFIGMILVPPVGLCFALFYLRGYAKGVFFLVSFILSMQLLFWLKAPGVSAWVNAWSTAAMESAERP